MMNAPSVRRGHFRQLQHGRERDMKGKTVLAVLALGVFGACPAHAGDDPFANVGATAGAEVQTPDGASSVRAKKKAAPEMFQGTVEAVEKKDAEFPRVISVKIRVTKEATSGAAPHNEIKKGKTYDFALFYKTTADGKLDVKDENTRENIGAFYLMDKDRVEAIVKEKKDGRYILDIVQRK
jgi:hypothetical protein